MFQAPSSRHCHVPASGAAGLPGQHLLGEPLALGRRVYVSKSQASEFSYIILLISLSLLKEKVTNESL